MTDLVSPALNEAGGQPEIMVNGSAWTAAGIGTLEHAGYGRYSAILDQAVLAVPGDVIETRYKSASTPECPGDQIVVEYPPQRGIGSETITWREWADQAQTIPLADVQVEFCLDAARTNVIAFGITDVNGECTVLLDPATYYVWRQKAGWNPRTNPQIITVQA